MTPRHSGQPTIPLPSPRDPNHRPDVPTLPASLLADGISPLITAEQGPVTTVPKPGKQKHDRSQSHFPIVLSGGLCAEALFPRLQKLFLSAWLSGVGPLHWERPCLLLTIRARPPTKSIFGKHEHYFLTLKAAESQSALARGDSISRNDEQRKISTATPPAYSLRLGYQREHVSPGNCR